MPRALHLLAQLFPLQLAYPSRSDSLTCRRANEKTCARVTQRDPSIPCELGSLHPAAVRQTMTSKRKREPDVERDSKSGRCRMRSRSEPTLHQGESPPKKKRIGRISVDHDNQSPNERADSVKNEVFGDENEDPLLDSVPVDMDPEQLGFLVCAQETLRFLHGRGIPPHHPMFARLRSRLLQGIDEMSVA